MTDKTNKKKPTVEELEKLDRYQKIQDLDHQEMVPFLLENIKERNPVTGFFKHGTMLLIAVVLFAWIGRWNTSDFLWGLIAGIAFTFTIGLVLHEMLHLLVYKLMGAKETKLITLWDQGAVVAVANHFVVSNREFYWLAFTPFAVLTAAGLAGLFWANGWILYAISFFIIFHATACIGDFSLAGFMYKHRKEGVYTFDDADEQKSYFYRMNSI